MMRLIIVVVPALILWLSFLCDKIESFSSPIIMSAAASTDTSPGDSTFAINVAFNIKPERREEFLETMKNNVKQTLENESNSLEFQLGQDLEDPNIFYLHEEYKSISDHRDVHSKTEYVRACFKLFDTNPGTVVDDEFYLAHPGPSEKIPNRECICLNVELNIKPECREEFMKVIENNKRGSDQEPGCLQYSWGENIKIPNTFHFHEQYIGEEGVAAHNSAPHFKVWEDFANTNPFTKPPTVQKYKAIIVE